MEITYGTAGIPAAVLNPYSGDIYALDGKTAPRSSVKLSTSTLTGPTAEMFAFLGGELYTRERDGKRESGTGFIPDEAGFVQCGVLNTDTKYPPTPVASPMADGTRCIVTAKKGKITHESHVIVIRESKEYGIELFFIPNRATEVHRTLQEPHHMRTGPAKRAFTLRSHGLFDGKGGPITLRELELTILGVIPSKIGALTKFRVLDLSFWGQLYTTSAASRQKPWEKGLGISCAVDGQLYFNAAGILRDEVPQDRSTWHRKFKWATFVTDPRPHFVAGDMYIVHHSGRWQLFSRHQIRTGFGDNRFRIPLTKSQVDAVIGNGKVLTDDLITELLPPPVPAIAS